METVFNVLNGKGKINIEDAIDKFLKIQTGNSASLRNRAKIIFMRFSKFRVHVKIEKVGKETFIELI